MLIPLVLASSLYLLAETGEATQDLVVRDWLVLEAVDGRGRRPFRPDAVFARHLLDPKSAVPQLGDQLSGGLGESAWVAASADKNGQLNFAGDPAWAYAELKLEHGEVLLADLQGASTLFINGVGFAGTPIASDTRECRLPFNRAPTKSLSPAFAATSSWCFTSTEMSWSLRTGPVPLPIFWPGVWSAGKHRLR